MNMAKTIDGLDSRCRDRNNRILASHFFVRLLVAGGDASLLYFLGGAENDNAIFCHFW